jgi:hypothetical protein
MITRLLLSFFLMALCVTIHASGITFLLGWIDRSAPLDDSRFRVQTWCLIRVAVWIIMLHLLEVCLWAALYLAGHALPDAASALYFSSVTYTTVGYGDLVLPERWRLFGGVEALTGILMCGWSTGFFFTVVTRMHQGGRTKFARTGVRDSRNTL